MAMCCANIYENHKIKRVMICLDKNHYHLKAQKQSAFLFIIRDKQGWTHTFWKTDSIKSVPEVQYFLK
jgi:hypothetical protein